MMMVAAAISMRQAQDVGLLLDGAIDDYIPAYASLARANVRSLEQALLVRQLVIARQTGHMASLAQAERDEVLAKGKAAADEVATARQLISSEAASRSPLGDALELVRLDTRLESLQRDLERLAALNEGILAGLATGDTSAIGPDLARLEAARSDINTRLDTVRAQMRTLLDGAGHKTHEQQRRVIRVSLMVAALAALLGLGL